MYDTSLYDVPVDNEDTRQEESVSPKEKQINKVSREQEQGR